jgi:CCR4-NOT transcription complex subunit 1
MSSCEQAVSRVLNHKSTSLSQLPVLASRVDHEINHLLRMVPVLLNQCPRDYPNYPVQSLWLMFSSKVFARVCELRHSQLHVEVSIQILKCIRNVCLKMAKELTVWLLSADDETKILITVAFLKARLLHVPDLDHYLAKQLVHAIHVAGQQARSAEHAHAQAHLDFVSILIRRVVVKEPILSVQDLPLLFDQPQKLLPIVQQRRHRPSIDVLMLLMDVMRSNPAPPEGANPPADGDVAPAPTMPQPVGASKAAGGSGARVEDLNGWLMMEEQQLDSEDSWDLSDEPAEFLAAITNLYNQWVRICLRQPSDKTYANYLGTLQQQHVLGTPESAQRFFLIITQLCIDSTYAWAEGDEANKGADGKPAAPTQATNADGSPAASGAKGPNYTAIDAVAKLVVFLVKFFQAREQGAGGRPDQEAQIQLLNCFLRAACKVMNRHFEKSSAPPQQGVAPVVFNQRPYFRLFSNLLAHLNTPDPSLDSNNKDVLLAFGRCFRLLRPSRVPSFCFAWLELISHRMFMAKLLISKQPACTVMFELLLVDLLEFMQPYLRNAGSTHTHTRTHAHTHTHTHAHTAVQSQ